MNSLLTHFLQLRIVYPHLAALVLCLVKSSLIIALTLLLAGVLGRRSALTRNWAWRGAIIGLLGLVFWDLLPSPLTPLRPTWRVSQEARIAEPLSRSLPLLPQSSVRARTELSSSLVSDQNRADWASTTLGVLEGNVSDVYRAGFALLLFWYAVRVVAGMWWLRRAARPIPARLQEIAQDAATELNLRYPCTVATCPELTTPLLAGWVRPTIFLPEDSLHWTNAKLEAVFIHELSHWRRYDGWWQTLGTLTTCLWWWQPLAWLAANALKLTAEQAADDAVVLRQNDASSYAQTLVEMAASLAEGHRPVGVAMIGRSPLETRVRSLLRDNPWRGRHGKLGLTATVLFTCLFLVLGGLYLRSADLPTSSPEPPAGNSASTPASAPSTPTPPTDSVAHARVVNAQGQPVAGASIQPYCEVRGDMTQYPATKHNKTHTDLNGWFSYSVPGYTKVGVMVVAPGYARKLVLVSYGQAEGDVMLGPGVTVTGRLLKGGYPVPDVEVGIVQQDKPSSTYLEEIVAKTAQDGRFALQDVAPRLAYQLYGKRDSLGTQGVTAQLGVTAGEPGTTQTVGDLVVEPGIWITGRIVLPNGQTVQPVENYTEANGTARRGSSDVQLHIYRENPPDTGALDYQFINLKPDLRFAFLARVNDTLSLHAWVSGYELLHTDRSGVMPLRVVANPPPVEMVYEPNSPEARERVLHPLPILSPAPTPTPSAQELEDNKKAAQRCADELATQPHRTEAQWREQFVAIKVGMTRDEVYALLPPKTVSIDYLQRDEYDEETVHTSFYALDGEFAVALTFDFKGDEAWNAAGRPSPRPKADENHLIKPPVLMRHDKKPNKDNEIQLEKARLPEPVRAEIVKSSFGDDYQDVILTEGKTNTQIAKVTVNCKSFGGRSKRPPAEPVALRV